MSRWNKQYIDLYKEADKTFSVNKGDTDLQTITFSLPSPPPLYLIDGHNLHPDEQYFRYKDVPKRLRIIEKEVADKLRQDYSRNTNNTITVEKAIDLFWDIFEERRDQLKEEEKYIKDIIWYRTYGYWFYNDGKPTWLPPDYFDYLNFWTMPDVVANGGRPEYRDVDRRRYLFRHYLETCTETFAELDENGFAVKRDGKYLMQDVVARTFFGSVEPKARRSGITGQACHKIKKGIESMFGGYGTIISMDGENAIVHFTKKLLPAVNNYPIFLKPRWDGNNTSKSIKYRTRLNDYTNPGLGGIIDYTESANEIKNDGDKLHFFLADEEGKVPNKGVDILERWSVNKLAQSTGGGSSIKGFCIHPSTVEQMNEGGVSYRKLCDMSNFYRRIRGVGQTQSGLGLIFFPAQDGLENFIDRFGMSVIDKPTERQIRLRPDALFAQIKIGSHEYLMQERKSLLADGSPRALETYRSRRRKMPMSYAECWIGTTGDMGFDLEKLDQREIELQRYSKVVKGDFVWEHNTPDTKVVFVPNVNGRWEVSMLLGEGMSNQKTKVKIWNARTGKWEWQWKGGLGDKFTIGADPVEWQNKTEAKLREDSSRQSNIGGGVLSEKDDSVDKGDDPSVWTTRRIIALYDYRPATTYEGNEDMLKACVYYGGTLCCESNKTNMLQHFIERGYGGLLYWERDLKTGKLKDKPGIYATASTIEELFGELKDYINLHIHITEFISLVRAFKAIRNKEDLTRWDVIAAVGWALVCSKRRLGGYYSHKKIESSRHASIEAIMRVLTH